MSYNSYGEREGFLLTIYIFIVAVFVHFFRKLLNRPPKFDDEERPERTTFYVRSRMRRKHLDLGRKDNLMEKPSIKRYFKSLFRW